MTSEKYLFPQPHPAPQTWQFGVPGPITPVDNKRQWAEMWRIVRKRAWMIVLIGFLAAFIAAGVASTMQPVYRSTATVLIESGKAKILSIEEVYSGVSQDREYYQTQVEILRSRDIARRTVLNTKLWNEAEFNPRAPRTGLINDFKALISKPPELPPMTAQQMADATVGKFMGSVFVEPVRLSQLVKVSFEANDPVLAANMANAIAQSYIESDRDGRLRLTQEVNGLLQDRMSALREKLSASEQALQKFREQEGLVNLSGSSQGLAGQQMGDVAQRLLAAKVRRTELENAYMEASKFGNADATLTPVVVGYPGISEAKARVASATAKLADLSQIYGQNHSAVIQAQTEVQAAQRFLNSQTQSVLAGMRRDAAAARETERALESALSAAKGGVQGMNRQEFQLGVLEREVQANKQLYELFLSRVKETSISSNLQAAVARVVDPASAASVPVRPNKAQFVGLAFVLSLVAAAIAAIIHDAMDNTVRSSDDAEHRLHQQVLASLPSISTNDQRSLTRLYLDKPMSNHAEGIRTARSGVLLSSAEKLQRTLLVTSTTEGEGKTTVCTNLALAHAQTKRTVLIDANMRDPQIGTRFGLDPKAKGLSNLIAGSSDIRECLHEIAGSSLLVMPAGDGSLNPQDLLLSRRFRELLTSLATRVEIIVIDSPPVNAVSDALIVSAMVSDTIYVVKAMETPYPAVRKGIDRLQRAGANVLGIVINQVQIGVSASPDIDTAESRYRDRRNGAKGWMSNSRKKRRSGHGLSGAADGVSSRRRDGERNSRDSGGVSESVFASVVDPLPPGGTA